MARHVAKNIVAAGLADRAQVQVAYAIGVADPVSIMVDTFGTGKVSNARLEELIRRHFDFTPAGIIKYLNLRRPIHKKTAAHRHFGRSEPEFTRERTDRAKGLGADARGYPRGGGLPPSESRRGALSSPPLSPP